MTETQKFDDDYSYLRKLVLLKKCKLGDAKLWLVEKGAAFEKKLLQESEELMQKRYSGNADREEQHINKVMKSWKGDDKDE